MLHPATMMDPADALASIMDLQFWISSLQDAEARWEYASWQIKMKARIKASDLNIDLDDIRNHEKQLKREITTLQKQAKKAAASQERENITSVIKSLIKKLAAIKGLTHAIDWAQSRKRVVFRPPLISKLPGANELERKVMASRTDGEVKKIASTAAATAAKVSKKVGLVKAEVEKANRAAEVVGKGDWEPEEESLLVLLPK